jgi:hypothetical protein
MKFFFSCLLVFIPLLFVFPQHIEIFPDRAIYQKSFADALSHQFSLNKDLQSREWFGNVGAIINLADLNFADQTFQVSAASTIFNTIIKTPGHIQVYTVDYLVDFFFDYEPYENTAVRFLFGHLSAHYSDDGIVELNNYPISYVRDYVGLYAQYKFKSSKIYTGITYNFHIEPETAGGNTFQIGGDKFFNIFYMIDLYAAVDFKIKAEVDYSPTQSYQAGIKLYENQARAIRIAYTFRNGFEERGQLYNIRDRKHSFGIYLDI